MTKRKLPRMMRTTTVETYSGSLAELAIAATKADRDLSWDQLECRIRQQISAPTGPHPIAQPPIVKPIVQPAPVAQAGRIVARPPVLSRR